MWQHQAKCKSEESWFIFGNNFPFYGCSYTLLSKPRNQVWNRCGITGILGWCSIKLHTEFTLHIASLAAVSVAVFTIFSKSLRFVFIFSYLHKSSTSLLMPNILWIPKRLLYQFFGRSAYTICKRRIHNFHTFNMSRNYFWNLFGSAGTFGWCNINVYAELTLDTATFAAASVAAFITLFVILFVIFILVSSKYFIKWLAFSSAYINYKSKMRHLGKNVAFCFLVWLNFTFVHILFTNFVNYLLIFVH